MRISRFCALFLVTGFSVGGTQALDADLSPAEAFRSGYEAYKAGDAETALEALNYAAERGHAAALWKLGRMYQTGDLVAEDDAKAMELYSRVAQQYGEGNPYGPDAPFVADSFVTLGTYYQNGIPGSVVPDLSRARRFFAYAASYFGDGDAQYRLATMFLLGQGGEENARQAARWFKLAASGGHPGAQAEFGRMLFEGVGLERRPSEGLMWITVARMTSPGDPAIRGHHEQAFSMATEAERMEALRMAETWLGVPVTGAQAQAQNAPVPPTPGLQ